MMIIKQRRYSALMALVLALAVLVTLGASPAAAANSYCSPSGCPSFADIRGAARDCEPETDCPPASIVKRLGQFGSQGLGDGTAGLPSEGLLPGKVPTFQIPSLPELPSKSQIARFRMVIGPSLPTRGLIHGVPCGGGGCP